LGQHGPFFLVAAHLIVSSQVTFKDAPDDVVVVSVSSCLGSKKRIVSGAIMNVVGVDANLPSAQT
jgi:hypothetical protein